MLHIGAAVEGVVLTSSFLRQPPFYLRPWLHRTSTSRAKNMLPEQVVLFIQWQMALIRFIRLEFFLCPFIDDRVDNSGYSSWYFLPVWMYFNLALFIRADFL